MNSRLQTGEQNAASPEYPRQMTFEIREDVISSEKSGLGSRREDEIQIDSRMSKEDVTSETKTMV